MSNDVGQAALLLTGVAAMWFLSHALARMLIDLMRAELQGLARPEFTITHVSILVRSVMGRIAQGTFPMFAILLFVAIGVGAAQAGLRITMQPLNINWSRLSIPKGWGRIFSIRSTMRGVMMLLKLSLGLGVILGYLWFNRTMVFNLGRQEITIAVAQTWTTGLIICFVLGGTLLAIGIVDYLYQRWQHEQELKMSHQDVKDEHKRDEGDPQIKAQRRRMAREALKQQMLKSVPEATVVLTNPTHFAVALKYDRDEMDAPRVVAKGTDAFARRIAGVARQNGVPVLERKPLARALYASVEVNQEIPPNLYRAIAEILAHLDTVRSKAG